MVRVAGVALVLSVGLGVATYLAVRTTVLEERETAAAEQVAADAGLVLATVDVAGINEAAILATLRPPARSRPLLAVEGSWYAASLQLQPADLPQELRDVVFAGDAAKQRFRLRGEPALGIGVPLPGRVGGYFEVFSLNDIADTLNTLARTLVIAGAIATTLGALAGWGISRRILRPLDEVSAVAAQISAGQLGTRLDEAADRDLARLTASFNAMAQSLEERIAREAQFSSDVSHELRSPLTTLSTSVTVLERRRSELSPEGREALDLLAADLRRFQALVTDLLEMSRHDAGVASVDLTPFELASFVTRLLRRRGEDMDLVVVEPGAATAVVNADERRLERALANVLDNAAAHGGGATEVRVAAAAQNVRISVADEGPGISEQDRDVIFERFARGASARDRGSRDGSGLGLALARESVRVQGGRIWVEETSDGGARFVIELPRVDS